MITSQGHNLSSDNTCSLQAAGDLTNTNPRLGSLANNGGQTQTLALLAGSPAIDAGSPTCPPPTTDQRGVRRPQGAHCDIGAFELEQAGGVLQTPTPSPTATPLRTSTPSPTATPVRLSVAQAVAQVRPSGQTGVACASQVGQTCQATGGVHGSGTVSGSMTWSLTATVPAGIVPGTVPVAVLSTTGGLQGFACAPVAAGVGTVTCIGTTAANALQASVVTVVFAPGVVVAGTVAGPGASPAGALVIVPLVPPPVVPPMMAPPPPFAVPPLLPPAQPQPLVPAVVGPAPEMPVVAGRAPEVPVVPEADSLDLMAGGLLGLALALGRRRLRSRRRD